MSDTALIIMARYPELGKTKTRLARDIGDTHALRLYQAFLADLGRLVRQVDWRLHWAFTPAEADFGAYIATLVTAPQVMECCFPQQGANLGERLLAAFQWAQLHKFQRAIVIGSDLPYIGNDIIIRAQKALEEADVVLGPAEDGGYYLIAMKQPYDVFSGIPMSTSVVLEMTIERAKQAGLRVSLLEALFDTDELPDLLRLAHLLELDNDKAPATASYLQLFRSMYEHKFHDIEHASTFDLHRANQPLQ